MQRCIALLVLLALVALAGCTAKTPPTTGAQPLPTASTTAPANVVKPELLKPMLQQVPGMKTP